MAWMLGERLSVSGLRQNFRRGYIGSVPPSSDERNIHMNKRTKPVGDLQELKGFLDKYPHTRFIDAVFVDLCGVVRGKRFPRDDLEKIFTTGVQLPHSTYLLDVTGHCNDPGGRGVSDGDPDGTGVPVSGTLAPCPWMDEPTGQVLMTMYDDDGTPSLLDPRNLAARVVERLSELNLTPVIAFELEFYLLDRERDAHGRPQAPISALTGERERMTQVFGLAELEGHAKFLSEVQRVAGLQNVPASVATTEFAPGQYEINLRHNDAPLIAADHCALFRRLVKSVASHHGLDATFMSKPFADMTGNGMHIHLSLLDDSGANVFDDGSRLGSKRLRHAVGGMMATMSESFAICAPNINAYRRFQPDVFVPVSKSWGPNNRSVAFRVPAGDTKNRRIEHRIAGAEANPYLVLAAVLAGAHYGLVNKIDAGPPSERNVCATVDPDLPLEWGRALDRLERAEILTSYIGQEYISLYCATKRGEMRKFNQHLSPLEYEWYL